MREHREGDQPLPTKNNHQFCHDHVIEQMRYLYPGVITELVVLDIKKRLELGIERYGMALQPFNGRDLLRDLYEELLDALAYGDGCIREAEINKDTALQYTLQSHLVTLMHTTSFIRMIMAMKEEKESAKK